MSLFNVLSVSASGLAAQRTRAELLVQNLANAETTRTPEGGPYRRKDVVFGSQTVEAPFSALYDAELRAGTVGVGVTEVITDTRDPVRRYLPGHPDADNEGYVAMPRVNPAEDMADLLNATRSYHANVSAMSAIKDMIQRSIDLFR
jgi:flagellar basal-body rod protein FlgC